jgi:hypothetical protein
MFICISVSSKGGTQPNDAPPDLSTRRSPNTVASDAEPHDVGGGTPHVVNETTPSDGGSSDGTNENSSLGTLVKTPLQLGKTLVIYHPHAQHPPEVIETTTLSLTREPEPPPLPETPWAPFASRADFEQAELFIKHNCTNGLINDQLRLNQKQDSGDRYPGNPPLMKNAQDLHKILEVARSDLDISSVSWVYLHPKGAANIDEE